MREHGGEPAEAPDGGDGRGSEPGRVAPRRSPAPPIATSHDFDDDRRPILLTLARMLIAIETRRIATRDQRATAERNDV